MLPLKDQLKRHSVALISLVIAITSLAYNTWRNEQTEANRNIRTAGIALLIKLGDLDRIAIHEQYGDPSGTDTSLSMNVRDGWALVLTARDLGSITAEPAITSSGELFETWSTEFERLGEPDAAAYESVSAAIDALRADVLQVLQALD
jgi:hypothetical protein